MEMMFIILKDLSNAQMILVIVAVIGGLIVLSSFAKWLGRKVSAKIIKKEKNKQVARAAKIRERKDEQLEHILENQEMLEQK